MRKRIITALILVICIYFIGICSYSRFFNRMNNNPGYEKHEVKNENILTGYRNADGKAEIIKDTNTPNKLISLSFEGIDDESIMNQILSLLKSYNVKSTFIITGIDSAENPEIINKIKKDGHELGCQSLSNDSTNMDSLGEEELIKNFSKSNKIMESITEEKSNLLKCKQTKYTDEVLKAAYAAGFDYVLDNHNYLSYQSFKNYEQAKNYINNIKNGTILSIKINGVLDDSEYLSEKKEEKPAVDKKSGIKEQQDDNNEVTIVQTIDWILRALNEDKKKVIKVTNLAGMQSDENDILKSENSEVLIEKNKKISQGYRKSNKARKLIPASDKKKDNGLIQKELKEKNTQSKEVVDPIKSEVEKVNFEELITENNKKLAEVNSYIYTIQNSVSYTFRGLGDAEVLDSTLEALKSINAKGTFFVTKEEIEKYPERINKIISYGNEIGNGGITNNSKLLTKSTEDICKEIYEVDIMLKNLGINTKAYMPGYGYINSNVQEAVSSMNQLADFKGYEIFTYSKSPIRDKYTDWTADKVVQNYFNPGTYLSLRKGEIVYFRLDLKVFKDSKTIGEIIKIITNKYVSNGYINRFNSKTNSYDLVQKHLGYSVVSIKDMQDKVDKRYRVNRNKNVLLKRSSSEIPKFIKKNYIGNVDVNLEGFTESEKADIDKEGLINTKGESTVFLSFDDWGSDVVINEILNVLNKHNVNGCFFVIGQYIDPESDISNANPNLLRTIAAYGNDIGSHSYNHETLEVEKNKMLVSLSKSYTVLDEVAGDLGAVKPYFRPPTLYVSKTGIESVFETGYKYVVSGNISTHDYEVASSDELLNRMEDGLIKNKGNIFVMHMNNQAYYTAEALDKFLTNNEQGKYGDVYKVAKLSDYLK